MSEGPSPNRAGENRPGKPEGFSPYQKPIKSKLIECYYQCDNIQCSLREPFIGQINIQKKAESLESIFLQLMRKETLRTGQVCWSRGNGTVLIDYIVSFMLVTVRNQSPTSESYHQHEPSL